jgi:hypothetical protein
MTEGRNIMVKLGSFYFSLIILVLLNFGCCQKILLLHKTSSPELKYQQSNKNNETNICKNNKEPCYLYDNDNINKALELKFLHTSSGNSDYFFIIKNSKKTFFVFQIEKNENDTDIRMQRLLPPLFKNKNCNSLQPKIKEGEYQCNELFAGAINSTLNDIVVNKDGNIAVTGHKASYTSNIINLWNLEKNTQINFPLDNSTILGVEVKGRKYNSIDAVAIDEDNQFVFGYNKEFQEILIWSLSNGKLLKIKTICIEEEFRKDKYIIKLNPLVKPRTLEIDFIFLEGDTPQKYSISYQYDCLPTDNIFTRLCNCESIEEKK